MMSAMSYIIVYEYCLKCIVIHKDWPHMIIKSIISKLGVISHYCLELTAYAHRMKRIVDNSTCIMSFSNP